MHVFIIVFEMHIQLSVLVFVFVIELFASTVDWEIFMLIIICVINIRVELIS